MSSIIRKPSAEGLISCDSVSGPVASRKPPGGGLQVAGLVSAGQLARDRVFPVSEALTPLVGSGLQRGTTVSVEGSGGAVSLALNLVAEAARQGAWLAVLGGDWLGLAAIAEMGVPLHQVVLVELTSDASWLTVVASLLDGFDIVMLANPPAARHRDLRLLNARVRERNAVLMRLGGPTWPEKADLEFVVEDSEWFGVGHGHGHLQSRLATVVAHRRRGAAQRRHRVWLPDANGMCRVEQPMSQARPGRSSVPLSTVFAGSDIDQVIAVQAHRHEFDHGIDAEIDAEADVDEQQRHLRRVV